MLSMQLDFTMGRKGLGFLGHSQAMYLDVASLQLFESSLSPPGRNTNAVDSSLN